MRWSRCCGYGRQPFAQRNAVGAAPRCALARCARDLARCRTLCCRGRENCRDRAQRADRLGEAASARTGVGFIRACDIEIWPVSRALLPVADELPAKRARRVRAGVAGSGGRCAWRHRARRSGSGQCRSVVSSQPDYIDRQGQLSANKRAEDAPRGLECLTCRMASADNRESLSAARFTPRNSPRRAGHAGEHCARSRGSDEGGDAPGGGTPGFGGQGSSGLGGPAEGPASLRGARGRRFRGRGGLGRDFSRDAAKERPATSLVSRDPGPVVAAAENRMASLAQPRTNPPLLVYATPREYG